MIKHNKIRFFSILIVLLMIFSSMSILSVSAEGEIPIDFGFVTANKSIDAGRILRVNVKPTFDSSFDAAGGLNVMRFSVRYNPEILDLVDPTTLEKLEIDESGNPTNGKFYIFGEVGMESNLSVVMNKDRKTIVFLYGSMNEAGDIHISEDFVQIAFRVRTDIEFVESTTTGIEMISPDAYANNKDVTLDITGTDLYVKITPPFKMTDIDDLLPGEKISMTGRCSIPTDSEHPFMATITKNGEVIEEKEITDFSVAYKVEFLMDEAIYEPGTYKLTLSYNNISASKEFEVKTKEVPPPTVTPGDEETEQPEDTENNNNTNTNGNNNFGGNNSADSNKDDEKEPTKEPEKDTENEEKEPEKKPVQYPSDTNGHWADANIKYVYENSLMNGYSDGTFGPENNITRAEFATVMARLLELAEAPNEAKFADATSHWAKGYIGALASKGIVGGVNDTDFAPDENITREQIAVILARALGLEMSDVNEYNDEEAISDWAYDSVYAVQAAGYMKGDVDNNFAPSAPATRAEVATIIYRLHSAK